MTLVHPRSSFIAPKLNLGNPKQGINQLITDGSFLVVELEPGASGASNGSTQRASPQTVSRLVLFYLCPRERTER